MCIYTYIYIYRKEKEWIACTCECVYACLFTCAGCYQCLHKIYAEMRVKDENVHIYLYAYIYICMSLCMEIHAQIHIRICIHWTQRQRDRERQGTGGNWQSQPKAWSKPSSCWRVFSQGSWQLDSASSFIRCTWPSSFFWNTRPAHPSSSQIGLGGIHEWNAIWSTS